MAVAIGSFPSRTCTICRLPGHTRTNCNILDPVLYARSWDEPAEVAVRIQESVRQRIMQRIEQSGFAPMTMSNYCLSVYGISFEEMKRRQRNNEGIPKQKSGNRKPRGYQRWLAMRASREVSEARRAAFRNSRNPTGIAHQGYRSNIVENDVIPEHVRQASIDAEIERQQAARNVFNGQAAEEVSETPRERVTEPEVVAPKRKSLFKKVRQYFKLRKKILEELESEVDVDVEVEEERCPICLDTLDKNNLFITECGHKFHAKCMVQCLRRDTRCPACRANVI